MDQQRMNQMQQDQHNQATNQAAQVADLTATFLNKRVRPSDVSTQMVARRGCVVEILEPDYRRGIIAGLRVHWDNGAESNCLAYMVTLAEED